MKEYLIARLLEPSTWRALILIATSLGLVSFNGEQTETIIALGMALSGAVGVVTPDSLNSKD